MNTAKPKGNNKIAWSEELTDPSEIAKSEPQAVDAAFIKGHNSKFSYFMRIIPDFENYVQLIQEILDNTFTPTLFGRDTPLPDLR